MKMLSFFLVFCLAGLMYFGGVPKSDWEGLSEEKQKSVANNLALIYREEFPTCDKIRVIQVETEENNEIYYFFGLCLDKDIEI